jgi:DnaJ-class molecular chaperone
MKLEKRFMDMFTVKPHQTKEVLQSFFEMMQVDDATLEKMGRTREHLKHGRDIALRYLVNEQIRTSDDHKFSLEVPYENPCSKCKGAGEIYKFSRRKVMVTCNVCNGESKDGVCGKEELCESCDKTGRYRRELEPGLFVNVECKTCGGAGVAFFKCRRCRGEGKVEITVLDRIQSTTPCDVCDGRGYFHPKTLDNPVIDSSLAHDLAAKIKSAEPDEPAKIVKPAAPVVSDPDPEPAPETPPSTEE